MVESNIAMSTVKIIPLQNASYMTRIKLFILLMFLLLYTPHYRLAQWRV